MKRTTYNFTYICDRCGFRDEWTHFDEYFAPRGWREVSGRGKNGFVEPKHFCPDCSRELFGRNGLAVTMPETEPAPEVHRISLNDGTEVTYTRDGVTGRVLISSDEKPITWCDGEMIRLTNEYKLGD